MYPIPSSEINQRCNNSRVNDRCGKGTDGDGVGVQEVLSRLLAEQRGIHNHNHGLQTQTIMHLKVYPNSYTRSSIFNCCFFQSAQTNNSAYYFIHALPNRIHTPALPTIMTSVFILQTPCFRNTNEWNPSVYPCDTKSCKVPDDIAKKLADNLEPIVLPEERGYPMHPK